MSYNFDKLYSSLGPSGFVPYLSSVENQLAYKLVTGAPAIDPFRSSAEGRGYGDDIFHYYTADRIDVCSGEVLGTSAVPSRSLIGGYLLSGACLDYDKMRVPGFQDTWRACSGEQRHDFSQQFTRFLLERGYIPEGVIGSVWTSISGEALGLGGRCYGITVTGEPHVKYTGECPYP